MNIKPYFEHSNVYTSTLSRQEIEAIINTLLRTESEGLFFNRKRFKGGIYKNKFRIHKNPTSENSYFPSISGEFLSEKPMKIRVRIGQNDSLLSISIFVIILTMILVILLGDEITVNGEHLEPTFNEILFFALFLIIITVIIYMESISSTNKAEIWIKKVLLLKEIE